jgi:hypothetical protein
LSTSGTRICSLRRQLLIDLPAAGRFTASSVTCIWRLRGLQSFKGSANRVSIVPISPRPALTRGIEDLKCRGSSFVAPLGWPPKLNRLVGDWEAQYPHNTRHCVNCGIEGCGYRISYCRTVATPCPQVLLPRAVDRIAPQSIPSGCRLDSHIEKPDMVAYDASRGRSNVTRKDPFVAIAQNKEPNVPSLTRLP